MRLVVPLMVAALALTGCGGQGGGSLGGAGQAAGGSDINPQPRGQVRDGGTLRLPMDIFPNNFNYNQVDGTGSDNLNIDPAVLPSLFTRPPTVKGQVRIPGQGQKARTSPTDLHRSYASSQADYPKLHEGSLGTDLLMAVAERHPHPT
jgi:hypothetical protein